MIRKRIAFSDCLYRLELRNAEFIDAFSRNRPPLAAELYFDGNERRHRSNDGRGGEAYGRILERDAIEAYIAEALPDGITSEMWRSNLPISVQIAPGSPSVELLTELLIEGVIS
jgi:hypothetical protein